MLKTIPLILLIPATAYGLILHAKNVRMEEKIQVLRQIRAEELLSMLARPDEEYATNHSLPEPRGEDKTDVLERIRMLRSHLEYNPDRKWAAGVLDACEQEITRLRTGRARPYTN